ncbi:MAG: hypothetical protein MN733_18450 [Nitrososphaera sp.]|nr:hypothetical protein [Nitrososphaera sp.]
MTTLQELQDEVVHSDDPANHDLPAVKDSDIVEANETLTEAPEAPAEPFVVKYGHRFYVVLGELPNGVPVHRDVTNHMMMRIKEHEGKKERSRNLKNYGHCL